MSVIQFPTTVGGKAIEPTAPEGRVQKLGLYPLGTTDVVMSMDLFNTIVAIIERGTAAERVVMAGSLVQAYKMMFVEVK